MSTTYPVGDRPLALAAHLERLAYLLETGSVQYEWVEQVRCNCGILARLITGESEAKFMTRIRTMFDYGKKTWSEIASLVCPITGVPTNEVFKQLHGAGLRFEDYAQFEYLNNPEVIEELNRTVPLTKTVTSGWGPWKRKSQVPDQWRTPNYEAAHVVVAYSHAWAALIRRFHETTAEERAVDRVLEQASK